MKTYVFSRDEIVEMLVKESLRRHDPSRQGLHTVTSNRCVTVSPDGDLKTITIELLEVDGRST